MQAILMLIPKVLMSMLSSLMTEKFIKWCIVYILEIIVKRTETDEDDKLLKKAKESWGME